VALGSAEPFEPSDGAEVDRIGRKDGNQAKNEMQQHAQLRADKRADISCEARGEGSMVIRQASFECFARMQD